MSTQPSHTSRASPQARILLAGITAALLLTAQTAANAVVLVDHKDYRVTHFFTLRPGGNVVPTVTANFFEHAWVLDPGLRSAVNPAGQAAGFANGGYELIDRRGVVTNFSRNGNSNGAVTTGSFAIPAAGIPFPPGAVSTANVPPPINSAQANSRFGVNPFAAGGQITGALQADGFAEARFDTVLNAPQPSEAYAFSYAQISARGGNQLRNGQIVWRPQISTPPVVGGAIAGRFNQRRGRDPIDFSILDLVTNDVLEAVLLDIDYDVLGSGSLDWDSTTGLFAIDAQNAAFHIDISSPYTLQQGVLDLEIVDGLIVTANDSGIFDGLLPLVGSSGTFSMALGDITLDYDFGDFNGHDLDVTASFSGGGSAHAGIPEPASIFLVLMGLIGIGQSLRRSGFGMSTR